MTCFYKSFPVVVTCIETLLLKHLRRCVYIYVMYIYLRFLLHRKDTTRAVVIVHLGVRQVFSSPEDTLVHLCLQASIMGRWSQL